MALLPLCTFLLLSTEHQSTKKIFWNLNNKWKKSITRMEHLSNGLILHLKFLKDKWERERDWGKTYPTPLLCFCINQEEYNNKNSDQDNPKTQQNGSRKAPVYKGKQGHGPSWFPEGGSDSDAGTSSWCAPPVPLRAGGQPQGRGPSL